MQRNAISHARLMRESTDRIGSALRSDDAKEHLIARRLFETPGVFHSWELEHSSHMRQIAFSGALRAQTTALRQLALRLIHGKALFDYLKRHQLRGGQRARLLAHFYPSRLPDYAVVQEHGVFLRKAGSFMCTSHLVGDVVHDEEFVDPLHHYETLYTEYFDLYCATISSGEGDDSVTEGPLLPLLKHQLSAWREAVLNPPAHGSWVRRERELRRPLGDTQRLPVLRR